jgi:hypothetical protein
MHRRSKIQWWQVWLKIQKKKVMIPDLLTHNVVSSAAPEALLRHQQRCQIFQHSLLA